jgi:hypothetical protein
MLSVPTGKVAPHAFHSVQDEAWWHVCNLLYWPISGLYLLYISMSGLSTSTDIQEQDIVNMCSKLKIWEMQCHGCSIYTVKKDEFSMVLYDCIIIALF